MARSGRGRVLWLLNHKALMPFEVPMLHSLGLETYVPKIVPENPVEFRSCTVDHAFDAGLTLPAADLDALNRHSFYDQPWSTALRDLINSHFDIVITAVYPTPFIEAVKWFSGAIVARVFGLDREQSYSALLKRHFPAAHIESLKELQGRFWFGQGYAVLSEVEEPWLAERAVTLPVGLAGHFFGESRLHDRPDHRILVAFSHVAQVPYYRAAYTEFKRDFGSFPHIIVGPQSKPVDDPAVAGYVSDGRLRGLYRTCRVFYYHSHEARHLHYSPLEAMCHGLPVAYPNDGLLARLTGPCAGQFASVAEARGLIARLLDGDQPLHDRIVSDQSAFVHCLCPERLSNEWAHAIDRILGGVERR